MTLLDVGIDNVLGVTRNLCYLSVLSQMKRAICWKNDDESGRRLYWRTIFQAREEGPRHHKHEDILRFVQQALDDISWTIDQAEFDDLLALKKYSAPGTDGIPTVPTGVLVAWVRSSSLTLIELSWKGSAIPGCFAESRTVFIPKTSDIDDKGRII